MNIFSHTAPTPHTYNAARISNTYFLFWWAVIIIIMITFDFCFFFVIFYFYNNNRLYSSLLVVNVMTLLIDQYVVNERLQLRIVSRSVFNDSSRAFVFLAHQPCFIGHSCCTTRLMVFIFFFFYVIVIALKAKTESMPLIRIFSRL